MFDTPKAAHFNVFSNLKPFAPHDPVGLDLLWSIARRCSEIGLNMMDLSVSDRISICPIISEFNTAWERYGIMAQLRID